jgi:hypothetical protein
MRHVTRSSGAIVLAAFATLAVACGSAKERDGFDDGTAGTQPPPGDLGGGNGGGQLGSSSGTPAPGDGEKCAAETVKATRAEVDVIVLIDTSGSMSEETNQVKQNINAFASTIGSSGLDYTVVMIAEKPQNLPFIPPGFQPPGICVPPPLGGASCADNPPLFHHLNEAVGSTDSLQIILDKYASYEGWLRPNAYKVFIEVTDDNSSLGWQQFETQLFAKDGGKHFGDANKRRYIFNSICGWKRNTALLSSDHCSSAENTSDQYQNLSKLTGGTVDSVCETDYSSVFGNIAKGLVTKLGCEFAFPKAQTGQTDPTAVVVNYTPGGQAAPKALTQVTDASKCGTVADAWYYDDNANPTKILFCPNTCTTAGADTGGKIEIAVGCKAPPPK